jgi:DNA-binding transcriptional LysR family regulator
MICEDRLVLVSRTKKAHQPGDPTYIFVDWGDEFRRAHAQVYPVNKGAKLSFGNGELALRYMLERGGCAYFPLRAVHQHLQEGRLHIVPKGAEFSVPVFLARSPMAHFEDWFDSAQEVLAGFGGRFNDMALDTIPLADWEGLGAPV